LGWLREVNRDFCPKLRNISRVIISFRGDVRFHPEQVKQFRSDFLGRNVLMIVGNRKSERFPKGSGRILPPARFCRSTSMLSSSLYAFQARPKSATAGGCRVRGKGVPMILVGRPRSFSRGSEKK
jgi:hypothetical protein